MAEKWGTLHYHCQENLFSAGVKLYASQCKNRFCMYCCGIRKAQLVHQYYPSLLEWKDPYFLTLTAKSVPARKLKARMKNMLRAFRRIVARNRQRFQRGTGIKLIGIRSLECNFNPVARTYNPHFHVLVPDRETAELSLKEWLELWTPKFAGKQSQKLRRVKKDREKDLIEVIKYEAKIITDPEAKKNKGKKGKGKIYARALDNIYAATIGLRVFGRFGFDALKKKKKKAEFPFSDDYQLWRYHPKSRDWVSEESDSTLTNYAPDFELENLLDLNIDTEAE